jgi:HK97 gp10 family phage protein
MLKVKATVKGNMREALKELEYQVGERVLMSAAAGMAGVLYKYAESYAAQHHQTGLLESAIRRRFVQQLSSHKRKAYYVSWNPKVAPHGQLLEYGTSRAPAYPFIAPAFSHIHEAIAEGKSRMANKFEQVKSGLALPSQIPLDERGGF